CLRSFWSGNREVRNLLWLSRRRVVAWVSPCQESIMITRLRLQRFKNFRDAELHLGPLTLLVGANATGKSNLRDAFRFLHGVGRGYSLAEIFGEKWGDGGELQWHGIRGGTA